MKLLSRSPAETQALGQALGLAACPGDLILLWGNLGSGKTCLVQGIARGLDVQDSVRSPTFVLVTQHPGRLMLYHIDLYRIKEASAASSLGLEEYLFGGGVTVIEWAERAVENMPKMRLWVTLTHLDYTKRSLVFEASGERHMEILLALKADLFGSGTQLPLEARGKRASDASSH